MHAQLRLTWNRTREKNEEEGRSVNTELREGERKVWGSLSNGKREPNDNKEKRFIE